MRQRSAGCGALLAVVVVTAAACGGEPASPALDPLSAESVDSLGLYPEDTGLELRVLDGQIEVTDDYGLRQLLPSEVPDGWVVLDGPEDTTYLVVTDWPGYSAPLALVTDPRTGWTVPMPTSMEEPPEQRQELRGVPDLTSSPPATEKTLQEIQQDVWALPYDWTFGLTVATGPDGRVEVVSPAAVVPSRQGQQMHVPGQAGDPVRLGKGGPSVRLLADGDHWAACLLGDVFAGTMGQPVAQWHGPSTPPGVHDDVELAVEDWDEGLPAGLLAVVPQELAEQLEPVWREGAEPVDLGTPVIRRLGGDAMALDWPVAEGHGAGLVEGLAGFDTDGDAQTDVAVLPPGANRTFTWGGYLGSPFPPPDAPADFGEGPPSTLAQEGNPLVGSGLGTDDLTLSTGTVSEGTVEVSLRGFDLDDLGDMSEGPSYDGMGRMVLDEDGALSVVQPEAVSASTNAGPDSVYTIAVDSSRLHGGELLKAMVITSDQGPMLVDGDPPVLLRKSPALWVSLAPEQDLWVIEDDGELAVGRLSDPDLPFDVDVDGIPTAIVDD